MSETMVEVSAYISASLADEAAIHRLRDELYQRIGLGTDYRLSEAHLTIIPSFIISEDCAHAVDKKLAELDLRGRRIKINGVGIWPNIQNPRVILLDCDIDLEDERTALLDVLERSGVKEMPVPVKPHITLFKCDNGYILDPDIREQILQEVAANRDQWETTIQYVDLVKIDQ
jgi:2'-5' RNA ligase